MKQLFALLVLSVLLMGCAGGPPGESNSTGSFGDPCNRISQWGDTPNAKINQPYTEQLIIDDGSSRCDQYVQYSISLDSVEKIPARVSESTNNYDIYVAVFTLKNESSITDESYYQEFADRIITMDAFDRDQVVLSIDSYPGDLLTLGGLNSGSFDETNFDSDKVDYEKLKQKYPELLQLDGKKLHGTNLTVKLNAGETKRVVVAWSNVLNPELKLENISIGGKRALFFDPITVTNWQN